MQDPPNWDKMPPQSKRESHESISNRDPKIDWHTTPTGDEIG
jgi:hypothetical protein